MRYHSISVEGVLEALNSVQDGNVTFLFYYNRVVLFRRRRSRTRQGRTGLMYIALDFPPLLEDVALDAMPARAD